MPLPAAKVDEAFRTSRLNRVFGSGVTNYVLTSTTINTLPYDHGQSKEELIALREQLIRNYVYATLTVDKKKLIMENLIGEAKAIRNDNANSDRIKEGLKKKSILLTRRITQLKENVSKITRINRVIRSFGDSSITLNEKKFEEIFKDLNVEEELRRVRKIDNQRIVQVELKKNLEELYQMNEMLKNDRDALIKEIKEIKDSYGKNVHLFDEIVKLSNGGEVLDEEVMDLDQTTNIEDEEEEEDDVEAEEDELED